MLTPQEAAVIHVGDMVDYQGEVCTVVAFSEQGGVRMLRLLGVHYDPNVRADHRRLTLVRRGERVGVDERTRHEAGKIRWRWQASRWYIAATDSPDIREFSPGIRGNARRRLPAENPLEIRSRDRETSFPSPGTRESSSLVFPIWRCNLRPIEGTGGGGRMRCGRRQGSAPKYCIIGARRAVRQARSEQAAVPSEQCSRTGEARVERLFLPILPIFKF